MTSLRPAIDISTGAVAISASPSATISFQSIGWPVAMRAESSPSEPPIACCTDCASASTIGL
ncbi:hypothetical protein EOB59_31970 [Mesorhizobium sp. M7A.F.Ca.MR.176.00.0.0]|nr:hypothetical protein EOB59_31970 [Mesorhizobium sp. M7A.F.Ca.MR.176.00.0.0]